MQILLAYDQGLEHGPTDLNERNVDPRSIMELAVAGRFGSVIFQKGLAEKYYDGRSRTSQQASLSRVSRQCACDVFPNLLRHETRTCSARRWNLYEMTCADVDPVW